MNKTIRLIIAAFIIFGFLAAPAAATAKAEKIPISGVCWIIGFSGDNIRYWDTNNGSHWRHALWLIQCEYNDPRLPQYILSDDNWNLRWDADGDVAHTHSASISTDDVGNPDNLWQGHAEAQAVALTYEDDLWNLTIHAVMEGLGIYQGYLFTSTWQSTPEGIYLVEGELLIPSGK